MNVIKKVIRGFKKLIGIHPIPAVQKKEPEKSCTGTMSQFENVPYELYKKNLSENLPGWKEDHAKLQHPLKTIKSLLPEDCQHNADNDSTDPFNLRNVPLCECRIPLKPRCIKSSVSYSGEKIKELRLSKHLTQKEFGAKLGYSGNYISRIEAKRIYLSPKVMSRIAEVFGVSTSMFLADQDEVLMNHKRGKIIRHLYSGYKIKRIRRSQKMSLNHLANILRFKWHDLDENELRHMENGSSVISYNLAKDISQVLGVKLSDIALIHPKKVGIKK